MIIDVHTHLFPNEIISNREAYFSSEPAFALLYSSPKSRLVGTDELLSVMDANRIDKCVVFGFPWQTPDIWRRHNDFIIEAMEKHSGRLIGLGCFDPFSVEAGRETERCLNAGLSGIGELAFYQSGIPESALEHLAPVMELCRRHGRPVMLHTNEPVGQHYPGKTPHTLAQIYRLIQRFPENPVILCHWGGGLFFFSLLKKGVKETLRNVYFDTAASPFLYESAVYRIAVDLVGSDKILFGSDYPLLSPKRYFSEMQQADLTPDERRRICGLNAARLFQVSPSDVDVQGSSVS